MVSAPLSQWHDATCPPHPTSSPATHLPTTLCAATLLLPKSANEDSIMPVAFLQLQYVAACCLS